LEDYNITPRGEWVLKWPGQAVLCVSSTYWTSLIHEAFQKGGSALKNYLQLNNEQINDIVALVRGKLSKQNRTTMGK
jgi:dynein heavy chain